MLEDNGKTIESNSLKKEAPKAPEKENLKTGSIVIGDKNPEELLKAMEDKEIYIDYRAKEVMENPDFTSHPKIKLNIFQTIFKRVFEPNENQPATETVQFVKIRIRDLGFSTEPTIEEIFEKARELGLELCPAEVGPQYRLQYDDQPAKEWLYIGMKPIDTSNGEGIFLLKNNNTDGLKLDFCRTTRDGTLGLDDRINEEIMFRFSSKKKVNQLKI